MEDWTQEEEEEALVNGDDLLWDNPDFLAKLAEAEDRCRLSIATSSTPSYPNPNPTPTAPAPTPQASLLFHPLQPLPNTDTNFYNTHSPPRQLLQPPLVHRPSSNRRESDDRSKEWGRVLEQRSELVSECVKPRKKESSKRDGQIKSVISLAQQNDADIDRCEDSRLEARVSSGDARLRTAKETLSFASIGVQTDRAGDADDDWTVSHDLSHKLQGIWGCRTDSNLDRNLVSQLFTACAADFQVFSACMTVNKSAKTLLGSVMAGSSSHALRSSSTTPETAKVSHLFSVLAQISSGLLLSEALFGPLLDLCDLENVAIVHSSLRILHVLLKLLLSSRRILDGRDNVKAEGFQSGANFGCKSLSILSRDKISHSEFCFSGNRPSNFWALCPMGRWTDGGVLSLPRENWILLYELVNRVSMKHNEECVRLEAISIMNVILMKTNACTERDLFGQILVFGSIRELLKKKTSSQVRKEALHLLHLLLNCPTILSKFCCGCKEESADTVNDLGSASTRQCFGLILEGLADCLTCCGDSIHDVELRKRAIITLAFLFSSGKSGFEILVCHKSAAETNFILLILQAVVSEMDAFESHSSQPADCVKARTLLIREALILLNRLVSSPVYSATVLRLLTSSRDMARLALDIASRFPKNGPRCGQFENSLQQARKLEIVDLTQVFRKRIFAYFGDTIS